MPDQGWDQLVADAEADGTAVTGTSEGSILPALAKRPLGPADLNKIGKKFRLTAYGRISNIVTTPGTLTLRVKLGPTSTIAVAASSAMQLNAVAKTNVTWWLDWMLTLRAKGSGTSANFMHAGIWASESVVGSPVPGSGGAGELLIPASSPAVGTGFDSTVTNILDLTAQFSLTGNSIQCHDFAFESMN
jgi:hypothetical protein